MSFIQIHLERWAGKLPTCESRIDPIVRLPIQISILHPPRLNTTPYGLEAGAHAELLEQSLRQILLPGLAINQDPYQRVCAFFLLLFLDYSHILGKEFYDLG